MPPSKACSSFSGRHAWRAQALRFGSGLSGLSSAREGSVWRSYELGQVLSAAVPHSPMVALLLIFTWMAPP